jgi:hypothetical protein
LETLESTFECLKVTPFNFPSVDAREVEQKLKDQVPNFEPAYFRRLNFDQALVSVFGLSKFQEIIVSTFAECTCAISWGTLLPIFGTHINVINLINLICFLQVTAGAQKLKSRYKVAEKKGKKRQNVGGTAVDHRYERKKKRAGSKVMSVINVTLQVCIVLSIIMEYLLVTF